MKAGILAVAAALAVGVSASAHHAHEAFHKRGVHATNGTAPAPLTNGTEVECGCWTEYVTNYGPATRMSIKMQPWQLWRSPC